MRIGSLFSGAGGLDMAVEAVFGGETVWHCEYDAAASKVLAQHWPGIPNHGDVTTIDWNIIEPVDILCGGYPCQPFSSAGQRKGHDDARHLWPFFADAIRRIRPRYVVLENVAGHRTMGFDSVLGDLAALGFDAEWCSLRASDVGAPHRRERLFVVAYPQHGTGHGERSRPEPRQGNQTTTHANVPIRRQCFGSGEACNAGGSCAKEAREAIRANLGSGDITAAVDWLHYADAIARWVVLTRPAPAPKTATGSLNPAFSEWLLGWPAGWVTEIPGIGRVDQLRIIGNGVVPQQASAALLWLLRMEVAA